MDPATQASAPPPHDAATPAQVEIRVQLDAFGTAVAVDVAAPDGKITLEPMLPGLHALADAIVDASVARSVHAGKPISCRAGCGACCRQVVPLAGTELRAIAKLVTAMPEPRQSTVRARFSTAMKKLIDSGLAAEMDKAQASIEDKIGFVKRYFALGIACPFLEAESCSIYADRPLVCREYLVTSPPEHCAALDPAGIETVPIAGLTTVATMAAGEGTDEGTYWYALIAALAFARSVPEPAAVRTAPEHLEIILGKLKS